MLLHTLAIFNPMSTHAEIWYWAQGCCPAEEFDIASYELFEAGVQTLEELDTEVPEGGVMPDHPMALALTKGLDYGELPSITRFRFYTDDLSLRDRVLELFPQFAWSSGEEQAQDWDRHWRERQQPVHVSDALWVRPPWVEFTPTDGSTVLILEAKSAFGTGEHESTSLTVQLMQELDLQGKEILDIGAGTGILSMFALKRGAARAVYTEIDPCAIPCLVENFAINGCAEGAVGYLGGLDILAGEGLFDVIVCNMIRSEVWPLRADIERLLKKGGYFVISGQLVCDRHHVADWYQSAGFALKQEIERGEWWAATAQKQ